MTNLKNILFAGITTCILFFTYNILANKTDLELFAPAGYTISMPIFDPNDSVGIKNGHIYNSGTDHVTVKIEYYNYTSSAKSDWFKHCFAADKKDNWRNYIICFGNDYSLTNAYFAFKTEITLKKDNYSYTIPVWFTSFYKTDNPIMLGSDNLIPNSSYGKVYSLTDNKKFQIKTNDDDNFKFAECNENNAVNTKYI